MSYLRSIQRPAGRPANLGGRAAGPGGLTAASFGDDSGAHMKTLKPERWLPLAACLAAFPACAANFITNNSFESGLASWRALWTREKDAGTAAVDRRVFHSGQAAVRVEHRGQQDWSLEPNVRVNVAPGDLFEYSAWVKRPGEGNVVLCVSTWDEVGRAVDWSYGERSPGPQADWQWVRTRLAVPAGVVQIQPRLIGFGPVTFWVDDVALEKKGSVNTARLKALPAALALSNAMLVVTLNTADGTLAVEDRRTRRIWRQTPVAPDVVLQDAEIRGDSMICKLFHGTSGLEMAATVQLDDRAPEFTLRLAATGEMASAMKYPHPFATQRGDYLVVPMNEGISYPVEDTTVELHRLIAYGGHGICMGFWGVTDGTQGQMAIIETPDDAAIKLNRAGGRLVISPEWDPQKRQFGYERQLRYVFFDKGGHVSIAKRYRAYAQKTGLFKTLAQKRQTNPNVDLLMGAVNVWCWDRNSVPLVRDLQAAGIERILWSNAQTPDNLRVLNALPGVLTSRYDIYQDVMDPAKYPLLRGVHSDWPAAAWPNDIILGANGQFIKGWGVEARDGSMINCGVICDKRAPEYARQRIPADLATHPYRCRFIDTTTAAPWHECYNTNHPMTRTESKKWKMELLRYVCEDTKQVTGCETGHDASVPFVHYFEGMLSLGPYRVPDAGRRMNVIVTNVPERVAKFQLGHNYRLPLWELVYHDCVVAQWYWGDYNNKLPALWDKRDLFNLLYGTPPMFMFDRRLWEQNKARFAQSYKNTCPYVRKVGYEEMTDHRFLTPDRLVQQTAFANGAVVTVNFGDTPYPLREGVVIPALGFDFTEPRP
jgi:hypothetical protein